MEVVSNKQHAPKTCIAPAEINDDKQQGTPSNETMPETIPIEVKEGTPLNKTFSETILIESDDDSETPSHAWLNFSGILHYMKLTNTVYQMIPVG